MSKWKADPKAEYRRNEREMKKTPDEIKYKAYQEAMKRKMLCLFFFSTILFVGIFYAMKYIEKNCCEYDVFFVPLGIFGIIFLCCVFIGAFVGHLFGEGKA